MWDLKYDANAFIYEAETDSQTENRLSSPRSRVWEGMDWEFGIGRGKLPLYIYNVHLYSTGSCIQYTITNHMDLITFLYSRN